VPRIDIDMDVQARIARWVAWALVIGSALGALMTGVAVGLGARIGDPIGAFALLFVTLGIVGTLIVRRARNQIGWIFVMFGIGGTLIIAGNGASLLADVRPFWGSEWLYWWGELGFLLIAYALPPLFLLFPDGHLPGRRWRWVLWLYVAGLAMSLLWSLTAVPTHTHSITEAEILNPTYVAWPTPVSWFLLNVGGAMVFASGIAAVVSLAIRYRRARGEERQQFRWVVSVAVVGIVLFVLAGLLQMLGGGSTIADQLSNVFWMAMVGLVAIGLPLSIILAVFRYRLYQLDVVITKAVVVAGLAIVVTVVYAAVVVGVSAIVGSQGGSTVLSVVAAAVVAVVFQPARDRLRRLANRLVYGDRATPYEVLTRFSRRMGETFADDDVLVRMAQVLASGTGAASATVWLGDGVGRRAVATFPVGAEPDPGDALVPVTHLGETLGALSVRMPPVEPMNEATRRLVEDLASQAGLVLHNVALVEDLRASRQRLVTAQDGERRKLERNIHDGAQQQLVALSVKARLAEQMLDRDTGRARELLADIQRDADAALDDLRDLARGIYPPVLADRGLAAALDAQARRSATPVSVEADGIGRFTQEVEAAVYFCALEALQNAAKYAQASSVVLRLTNGDGQLTFEVADDGVGFDPASTGYGTGLHGIADRLAAAGGRIEIDSSPGAGTRLRGTIPVEQRA
jgi:signal transduction histidine kinase